MKTRVLQIILLLQGCLLLTSCGVGIPKSLRGYTIATVTAPNTSRTTGKYPQYVSSIKYQTDSSQNLYGTMKIDACSPINYKLCKDEKFWLVYNKIKPSKYVVYEDKPVFVEGEPYVETIGTVKRVSPLCWDAGVEYSYMVRKDKTDSVSEDTLFTKFQEVGTTLGEKSRRRQFPHLKRHNKYIVKYSPSNPQRAVIYL
jgi:hypothetical protein